MTRTTRAKGLSIGAAMKNRMQEPAAEQPASVAITQAAPVIAADTLEPFTSRLPAGLHRRLKIYVASEKFKVQDVLSAALEQYLDEKEGKQ